MTAVPHGLRVLLDHAAVAPTELLQQLRDTLANPVVPAECTARLLLDANASAGLTLDHDNMSLRDVLTLRNALVSATELVPTWPN